MPTTLSPAGTSKCAVSKCDSPRSSSDRTGVTYTTDHHTDVSLEQLYEMGEAGWLCSPWLERHIAGTL